jgi:hypothetical protein
VVRVFSLAIIAAAPYSIVRQPVGGRVCRPTDRNPGVLFFPISLPPCARSGGERNSPWENRGQTGSFLGLFRPWLGYLGWSLSMLRSM